MPYKLQLTSCPICTAICNFSMIYIFSKSQRHSHNTRPQAAIPHLWFCSWFIRHQHATIFPSPFPCPLLPSRAPLLPCFPCFPCPLPLLLYLAMCSFSLPISLAPCYMSLLLAPFPCWVLLFLALGSSFIRQHHSTIFSSPFPLSASRSRITYFTIVTLLILHLQEAFIYFQTALGRLVIIGHVANVSNPTLKTNIFLMLKCAPP